MILTFSSSHNSIREFPTTELPAFTLITGLNGSGKSHLLQALTMGKVICNETPNYHTEARLFTWTDMVPQDTGGYSGLQIAQERESLFQQFINFRQNVEETIRQPARAANITGKILNDLNAIAVLSERDLLAAGHNEETAIFHKQNIANGVTNASNQILASFQNNGPYRDELQTISHTVSKPVVMLTADDFKPAKSPNWGKSQPFQQQFSKLFCQYAELVRTNSLKKFFGEEALDDMSFQAKYMKAPWDFVNETFRDAGLDFSINQPDRVENTIFTPKLTKLTTGDEILFGSLSSGEKIIMSFALCMYYAGEGRQLTTYPKLLLLDEVDAPLHPSMSRHFITTITETLVKKLGVNVIATTHSPSTVALAPNDSIHVMRIGQPGVHKATKAEALNLLTFGVPTLAIEYSGRRQVFVESPLDAELYDRLYQLLKPQLKPERSLHFIGVGRENPSTGTHEQTGSTIVGQLIFQFEKSKNISAFGLLDWDGKNKPQGRLLVMGYNERYTLENVILDPIAIAALIARTQTTKRYLRELGLGENTSYFEILNLDAATLQILADKLIHFLFEGKQDPETQLCKYVAGFSLNISKTFLHMQGHDLYDLIVAKIPEFKIFKSKLKQEIVGSVFNDKPDFIPSVLYEIFCELLQIDSHT